MFHLLHKFIKQLFLFNFDHSLIDYCLILQEMQQLCCNYTLMCSWLQCKNNKWKLNIIWSITEILDNNQGLNFRAVFRDLLPKIRNPLKNNREGGRLPPLKNSSIFVILDNFLVSKVISYCQSQVTTFTFYQELNIIWSENSEFSHKISHILQFSAK